MLDHLAQRRNAHYGRVTLPPASQVTEIFNL
jgi:hypothetical protein